jgi:choline dehydrogenase-like flavoprotein
LSKDYEPLEVYPQGNLDRQGLVEFFKKNSAYGDHICGTCAMGKVVDSNGLVYNIKGLRVIDASIFPTIVSANPCFPVYMVAEKISRQIVKKYRNC